MLIYRKVLRVLNNSVSSTVTNTLQMTETSVKREYRTLKSMNFSMKDTSVRNRYTDSRIVPRQSIMSKLDLIPIFRLNGAAKIKFRRH